MLLLGLCTQAFRTAGVAGVQHQINCDDPQIGLTAADGLPSVMQMIRTTGWCGGSVTHPFKEAVVPLCDELDPTAEAMGAVNTVVVVRGAGRNGRNEIHGHNTDWIGVAEALREAVLPDGALETVAVIGVGGVARAVCFALAQAGAGTLRLYDPAPGKADEAAAAMREAFRQSSGVVIEVKDSPPGALDGASGVCQCSPIGMDGHPGTPFPPELLGTGSSSTAEQQWLLDCVYTPVETELVAAARERGLTTITGDRLNLFQFLAQFELVTGLKPDAAAAESYFRALLAAAARL